RMAPCFAAAAAVSCPRTTPLDNAISSGMLMIRTKRVTEPHFSGFRLRASGSFSESSCRSPKPGAQSLDVQPSRAVADPVQLDADLVQQAQPQVHHRRVVRKPQMTAALQ